jgi:drug/metabolite transporter (DMT)-like permease
MDPEKGRSLGGIVATLLSTLFSGLAPIFGKMAYQAGVDPSTLVAVRTALAAGFLWLFYLLHPAWRRYVKISWRNLAGCVGMGIANGVGSLLYYNGLTRVDASLAHLLYSMYPFWVFIFLSAAGHPVSRLAVVRLGLALSSVFLLTWQGTGLIDPLGVTLMLGAGALYGWHLVLGQWPLADVDSRTVTLYGLTRLLVFAGLRRLGGVQTSLLGVAELLVAVAAAFVVLGDSFTLQQWLGSGVFVVSVLLIARDTSLQIADEESWWGSLFPEASAGDADRPLDGRGTGHTPTP